jgi:K+-transporting ATPase KdpF subunit
VAASSCGEAARRGRHHKPERGPWADTEASCGDGFNFRNADRGGLRRDARPGRGAGAFGKNRMTLIQLLANVAAALAVYLLYALLKAEKF